MPGKVVGPSFSAEEVPDVIEAVLDTYRDLRTSAAEHFIDTLAPRRATTRSSRPPTPPAWTPRASRRARPRKPSI
jgi:sulfite reductase beta subunit-like hemoprotein